MYVINIMGNLQIKEVNSLDEMINSLLYNYVASLNFNNLIELSSKTNTNKLILKQSQKVRATASAASDLEVTLSALEITV